ncbi:MAG: RES family NAD+ phosphorylase [Chloroflexi bacterium]|nr:RES family NAD+ phosphorylase [Chloroflexota bacterium]
MATVDWLEFADEIKFGNRFFPQNSKVLRVIDEIFDKHFGTLGTGTKLYRARLIELSDMNIQDEVLSGFSEKGSMSPDTQIATAQRASPEKISYLYVAQDEYTALSETRPGIFSFISLAELESVDELRILDIWFDINVTDMSSDFSQLATSFSAVIAEKEKEIDYLPIQYVAEYIKNKGADGIRYISYQSQGGKNIVIFRKEKVEFLQSKILYNQNVAYSFLDLTNPERKPLVNSFENSSLPKDFAGRIKNTVIAIQEKKTKSKGG